MNVRVLFSILALGLVLTPISEARRSRRGGYVPNYQPSYQPQSPTVQQSYYPSTNVLPAAAAVPAAEAPSMAATPSSEAATTIVALAGGATEALAEVNARRAEKGLYPYVRDDSLTQGAAHVAAHRAQYLMAGHTSNDFGGLPAGARASGSGCAAWEPSWGWGSCCTDDVGPRYAGAAWAMGRDGRRYMHLFVR